MRKILILGGYGNFGYKIAEHLAAALSVDVDSSTVTDLATKPTQDTELIIAGRNLASANHAVSQLQQRYPHCNISALAIDIQAASFSQQLCDIAPFIVIHTSGPFQKQGYQVPLACILAKSHYIDLADDRDFVCNINILDQKAKDHQVSIVSGASSVPGLSSCVINELASQFANIDTIDFAIAPGYQAQRGQATIEGILSYTGHPFSVLVNGQTQTVYGWMNPRQWDFGAPIGKRWLANIDIPDLALFPTYFQAKHVQTVRFQAGLELPFLHFSLWAMALVAKLKLIANWQPFGRFITQASHWFDRFGTDCGGMQIRLIGTDHQNKPKIIHWTLVAPQGVGPYIPTFSAIILSKQLLSNKNNIAHGAMPCLGLFDLSQFDSLAKPLGIYHHTQNIDPTQNIDKLTT